MRNTKTKTISIKIPARFKWLVQQPTGEYQAFVHKPILGDGGDYYSDDVEPPELRGKLIQWWDCPVGESLELGISCDTSYEAKNWKKSLRKI